MADVEALENDGTQFAREAVESDKAGNYDKAIFFYTEAAQALLRAKAAGSQIPNVVDRANDYILRCHTLKGALGAQGKKETTVKTPLQLARERATFLLQQAFDEDKSSNLEEAIYLYSEAVELLLQVRNKSSAPADQQKAADLAEQALSRAEELKKTLTRTCSGGNGSATSGESPAPAVHALMAPAAAAAASSGTSAVPGSRPGNGRLGPLGLSLRDEMPVPAFGRNAAPAGAGGGGASGAYTKEEIDVLRKTSFINGREYVPFLSVDTKERFAYPVPFNDKNGLLALSPKQKALFSKWVRPDDFMDSPQMIYAVSSMSIRQTVVSDCSFVASLAVSAQYERRFNKKLITSIIYPQNRSGEPQYNPCGKYMVKLNINGVPRKVVVDDYLPLGVNGDLLCSFSNNRNELWVSILEKAYMKVMGGYDFPGSNSNIDLHALTGWIPERIAMRSPALPFDKDKEYRKIHERFHKGDCLVTVATGELSEAEAARAGLVPSHAYALLDIQEVQGVKLLMLKNPWNHLRWKGNYSERDELHWTPELQRALSYNPANAQSFDNGVFWIDYNSFCQFYECIYVNWSPSLFKYTSCIHHTWTSDEGPVKDAYNMGENPQYTLQIRQPAEARSAVWILLTRHITDKDDFADNKEFITVLVFKTDGKRVYYPSDPPPYRDGVRINSPHYLVKMVEGGSQTYTLVISQYEKRNAIHYTLRVYAQCEFDLKKIGDPYQRQYRREIQGKWEGTTAGGCGNHSTYSNNPLLQLKIDNAACDNYVLLLLKAPQAYSIGLDVVAVTLNASCPGQPKEFASGPYRRGFCVLRLDGIVGGIYNVRPSTFLPNQEGPFFLTIQASCPISCGWLR